MSLNTKDLGAAAIFIGIGIVFALDGVTNLRVGTPLRMGPGFIPIVLATVLICLGLAIGAGSVTKEPARVGLIAWRALTLITFASIIFGLALPRLGLPAALAMAIFICAFASRRATLITTLALTIGLTCFCVLIFHYGLGLQLQLLGPWLGG